MLYLEYKCKNKNHMKLKLCLHVTSACAFASNVKNGFYGNKRLCLHLMSVCACDAENGSAVADLRGGARGTRAPPLVQNFFRVATFQPR